MGVIRIQSYFGSLVCFTNCDNLSENDIVSEFEFLV